MDSKAVLITLISYGVKSKIHNIVTINSITNSI